MKIVSRLCALCEAEPKVSPPFRRQKCHDAYHYFAGPKQALERPDLNVAFWRDVSIVGYYTRILQMHLICKFES